MRTIAPVATRHPWDDEDDHRQQLEETREDRAAPGLLFVGGAQGTLHDVLIRAPVP
jgi:hypothetical protein